LFDRVDGIRGLHLESDGLSRQGLDKNLHSVVLGCGVWGVGVWGVVVVLWWWG
jgi:hypothetical protein